MKYIFLSTILLTLTLFITACGGGSEEEKPQVCTNGAADYPVCSIPICDNGATDYPICSAPVCENGGTDYPACSEPVCENGGSDYPACTGPTLPEFMVESDFYNDTSLSIPNERKRTLAAQGNVSAALQTLIDELSEQGGGIITIPAGEWLLGEIRLKSNVHIHIDPKAIITPKRITWNGPIFHLGYTGGEKILNVSVRSTSDSEKFTIDMSGLPDSLYVEGEEPPRVVPFSVKHVDNFLISGVYVIDKFTIHASVNLVPSKTNEIWAGSSNGLVKNITVINAHGGYGAVQVRVGDNVLFKNIHSLGGGSTLRIETDAVSASGGQAPLEISKISDIFGYNISCKDGNSALMIQPWGASNGRFDVQKINSSSCGAAVRIDRAFVEWRTASGQFTNPNNLPVGSFAADSRITDVHTVYGTNAQIKQGTLPFVPCELRYLWLDEVLMETFHQGPSISPLLYAASSNTLDDSRFYEVIVPSEEELMANSTGFPSTSNIITRDDHKTSTCN